MSPSGDRIQVLHLEDDPDFASLTAEFLEREDESLRVAYETDPAEGLDRLTEAPFDCVVSDYQMPGMDGLEVCDRVREIDEDLPFILFTGKGSEEIASEAISRGATDYLQKEPGGDQYAVLANRIRNAVDQYRSRQAVAETERRLSELAAASPDALFMFTADLEETLFVNDAYASVLDQSPSAVQADPAALLDTVGAADRSRIAGALERLANGASVEVEWHVAGTDRRWASLQGEPIREDGTIVRVVGAIRDVTARRGRERDLERKSELLDAIAQYTPLHLYIKDEGARHIWVSDYYEGVEDILGKTDAEYYDGDWAAETTAADRRVLETGEPLIRQERHDPERDVWVLNSRIPWRDEDGEVIGLVGITFDVTERERTARRLAALFDNSPLAIAFTAFEDGEPIVRDVNESFERTFGYDADEATGRSLDALVVPADERDAAAELTRRARAGESIRTIVRREAADGVREFLLFSVPLEEGNPGGHGYAVYCDVTDLLDR